MRALLGASKEMLEKIGFLKKNRRRWEKAIAARERLSSAVSNGDTNIFGMDPPTKSEKKPAEKSLIFCLLELGS